MVRKYLADRLANFLLDHADLDLELNRRRRIREKESAASDGSRSGGVWCRWFSEEEWAPEGWMPSCNTEQPRPRVSEIKTSHDPGAKALSVIERSRHLSTVTVALPVDLHHPMSLAGLSLVLIILLRRERQRRWRRQTLLQTRSSEKPWEVTTAVAHCLLASAALFGHYIAFGLAFQASLLMVLSPAAAASADVIVSEPKGLFLRFFQFLFFLGRSNKSLDTVSGNDTFSSLQDHLGSGTDGSALISSAVSHFSGEAIYLSSLCAFIFSALATVSSIILENKKNPAIIGSKSTKEIHISERIVTALAYGAVLYLTYAHLLPLLYPTEETMAFLIKFAEQYCPMFLMYCVCRVIFPSPRCQCTCHSNAAQPAEDATRHTPLQTKRRPSASAVCPTVVNKMGALALEAQANLEKRRNNPRRSLKRSQSVCSMVQYGRNKEEKMDRRPPVAAPLSMRKPSTGFPTSPTSPVTPIKQPTLKRWSSANTQVSSPNTSDLALQLFPTMALYDLHEHDGNISRASDGDNSTIASSVGNTPTFAARHSLPSSNRGNPSSAGVAFPSRRSFSQTDLRAISLPPDELFSLPDEEGKVSTTARHSPTWTANRPSSNPQAATLTPVPVLTEGLEF